MRTDAIEVGRGRCTTPRLEWYSDHIPTQGRCKTMFSTDHLRKLAEEERSDFLRRIVQRVAPDEAPECEDNLRGLVLMVPLLLGRLRQLWNQPNMPSGVRNLS